VVGPLSMPKKPAGSHLRLTFRMFINMTLTTQPNNIKRTVITIVVMAVYFRFLSALLAVEGTMKESSFNRFLEYIVSRNLFGICGGIATNLGSQFFRILFPPFLFNESPACAVSFEVFSTIFVSIFSVEFSPLANSFRMVLSPLFRPLCLCKCHEAMIP